MRSRFPLDQQPTAAGVLAADELEEALEGFLCWSSGETTVRTREWADAIPGCRPAQAA